MILTPYNPYYQHLIAALSRVITLRTKIGSVTNSIEQAKNNLESDKVNNLKRKSMLVDADIGDLFAELSKQKSILELSYKSGQATLNKNLLILFVNMYFFILMLLFQLIYQQVK